MKKLLVVVLALLVSALSVLAADISGDVYTAGVSKYLWRGQLLNKGVCVQPGFDIYIGNFSIGYWANYSAGQGFYDESDYTIGYSEALPVVDFLTVGAGYTVYTYPMLAVDGNIIHSTEIYTSLSANVLSAPYVKFFYDATFNIGYLEGGVSHSIDLSPVTLGASVSAGYNASLVNEDGAPSPCGTVALGTLSATYALDKLSFTLSGSYQLALSEFYENDGFGSLSAKYAF